FENNQNLTKLKFQDIIRQIYQKTSRDVLDFYLIIYNAEVNIISFDYITGFRFKTKGMDIFKIEKYLNDNFFDLYIKAKKKYIGQLKDDYFSSLINTKNKPLDNLLYRFRSQIFDYVYRANYNSLNVNCLFDIYMTSLARKLKDFYDPENSESRLKKNITLMIESFYELNKYFGGDFMETIDRIKQEKKVRDAESFAYFAGQCVYYLLSQSESSAKTHAMVEPFINIRNLQVFRLKLEELFKAYKHKISLNNRCFNSIFSDIWAFLATNSQVQFSDNMKAFFYAGYFNTNENIFYEKKEDKGE
ncbi:hypothetical protein KJ656_16975, partial [bacterium]|nr:hypothetical protein [bacterium]